MTEHAPDTPFAVRLTHAELTLLARLIGHHTTGPGLMRVYDDEIVPLTSNGTVISEGPLEPALNTSYGDRPMVRT